MAQWNQKHAASLAHLSMMKIPKSEFVTRRKEPKTSQACPLKTRLEHIRGEYRYRAHLLRSIEALTAGFLVPCSRLGSTGELALFGVVDKGGGEVKHPWLLERPVSRGCRPYRIGRRRQVPCWRSNWRTGRQTCRCRVRRTWIRAALAQETLRPNASPRGLQDTSEPFLFTSLPSVSKLVHCNEFVEPLVKCEKSTLETTSPCWKLGNNQSKASILNRIHPNPNRNLSLMTL